MNFQPTITRKELAAKVGMSVDTLRDKYGQKLERARSHAIDKPVTYFAPKAFGILVQAGAISTDD